MPAIGKRGKAGAWHSACTKVGSNICGDRLSTKWDLSILADALVELQQRTFNHRIVRQCRFHMW